MVICALVITFFVVVLTGPYYVEKRERRKLLKDRPLAKVLAFPYDSDHPHNVR
jgi:hypothetical protein